MMYQTWVNSTIDFDFWWIYRTSQTPRKPTRGRPFLCFPWASGAGGSVSTSSAAVAIEAAEKGKGKLQWQWIYHVSELSLIHMDCVEPCAKYLICSFFICSSNMFYQNFVLCFHISKNSFAVADSRIPGSGKRLPIWRTSLSRSWFVGTRPLTDHLSTPPSRAGTAAGTASRPWFEICTGHVSQLTSVAVDVDQLKYRLG